ncbi:amino acid adenylation domain-containing protein [Ruminiclostridium papyrosolvens DSM 2782]|uniref:non-ribosomal peptide synthetase n=1 Tax=Ruminiclostridium papyrosolvens TaxID=29362 RepID=UPI0023E40263|nr:amino acid adenylation domain-containing protein [Ruminiclostridium papyrosolvens]WES35778.1 amino acid adenylation domain-containing protein [Ruminiclostridium papyrosolvens DSM 2782]
MDRNIPVTENPITPHMIHRLFESQALSTPNNTALILGEKSLSYKELNERANQLAWKLREKGVQADRIVGIMVNRSFEMIIGILGVLKAGGAYLPIDPAYPADRIQFMLEDSSSHILLSQKKFVEGIHYEGDFINLDEKAIYAGDDSNPAIINSSKDLAYVIYTSGSTGTPKGVMIEHGAVCNFIRGISEKIDFSEGKTILALTTISFDIFVMETLLPLSRGLSVVIADESQQKNPKLLNELIIQNHVDMLQSTPSRMQLLLRYDEELQGLKYLKEIMVGGEPLPTSLLERLKCLSNAKIYNLYGPTETTVWSTLKDVSLCSSINIGKPICNTQIYIVDENSGLQPVTEEGELCIAGDGLARGYLNRPELTEEKFVANPFNPGSKMYRTGDLAQWLPDGNIEFLGRIDNQIKLNGYRIELEEIEYQLLKHHSIKEAVVIAKEGKEGNKFLCAYFMSDIELQDTVLKEYLSKSLPQYMIPPYFMRLEKFPLTPNGKMDRKWLPEIQNNETSDVNEEQQITEDSEENEIEARVKTIIRASIDIQIQEDSINLKNRFSDFGIDSLLYIKIVVLIENEFGLKFDDDALNMETFPDIQRFITYIVSKSK